jgi:carboxyl-terminal processing protease
LRTFAEVFNAIKTGYVEPVDDKKLITHAISGMLSNLDPHSSYLDADAFKDLQVGTQGEFGGIGIEVGMEDGLVKVVSPIEDTPAYRAGVKPGDLIFKIDDTLVKGLTLSEAVKRMRGKPKSQIKLSILRKGAAKPLDHHADARSHQGPERQVQARRRTVTAIFGSLPSRRTRVRRWSSIWAISSNPDQLKGLVLDLRNDPGGLLNSAVGVSAAFLPPDTLVTSTDGRTPDAKHRFSASPADYLRGSRDDYIRNLPAEARTVPMVVLVNGGSASASEIVAGALQDHKRAVVLGTTSFGKGSVQTVLPLPGNTAIKLTTARYFTPSGRSIQAKASFPTSSWKKTPTAVRPSACVKPISNITSTTTRMPPRRSGKCPSGHPRAAPVKPKGNEPKEDSDESSEMPSGELASKKDYQLNQALNLLKGMQILKNTR